MSLTDAIKEAYAEPDVGRKVYDTLQMDHPAFATPVRVVCNVDSDMTLGGQLHTAMGVTLKLTGFDDDGEVQGMLEIDNVSDLLRPYLEDAVLAGVKISVTYRGYLDLDLTTAAEIRAGFYLSKVTLTATTASGTLEGVSKHDIQAFPRLVYDADHYPALHGISA